MLTVTKIHIKTFPGILETWDDVAGTIVFVQNGKTWERGFMYDWRREEQNDYLWDLTIESLVEGVSLRTMADLGWDEDGYIEITSAFDSAVRPAAWVYTPVEGGLRLTEDEYRYLTWFVGQKIDTILSSAFEKAEKAYLAYRDEHRTWETQ